MSLIKSHALNLQSKAKTILVNNKKTPRFLYIDLGTYGRFYLITMSRVLGAINSYLNTFHIPL